MCACACRGCFDIKVEVRFVVMKSCEARGVGSVGAVYDHLAGVAELVGRIV